MDRRSEQPTAPAEERLTTLPDWIGRHLPEGVRHRLVQADRERMHVVEWGPPDGHAIVLLHGNPTWSFLWRKVVAAVLARRGGDRLRLVAPDLIGLGLSSKPNKAAHSLLQHAEWLGEVIDRVVAGPLVLAVQDWGGPIGLVAMSKRRERLRGLVVGNTGLSPPRPDFKPTLFHRLAQLPIASNVLFEYLRFPLDALHRAQGDRSSIRGETAKAYRWPLARRADRSAPLALARMVPDSLTHPSIGGLQVSDELFRTAQVPVNIVWGDRDPVLGKVIKHLVRIRPDAKVVRTNAGHFLQEEVPEELADAILDVAARASWA